MKRATACINGINLFYRDTAADLPVILCLHGRWGRGETWTDFIKRYRDRYRLIAPDQRGHGLSDKPDSGYTAADLAEDAYQLVRYLNCGPVIVVGHSMGGRIAAHLTTFHPEAIRALVILDETAEGDEQPLSQSSDSDVIDDGLTKDWPTPYPTLDDAVTHLSSLFPNPTNLQYFMQSLTETTAGYDFLFSRRAMAELKRYNLPWFDILPQIKCPTLLVRAAESWCLSAEAARKMLPLIKDVTYFEVSRSDHMVYVDNPNEFYPQFERFLNRIT